MTTSAELLRFFHAEAFEYLDAIESFVASEGSGPDAGAFVSAARALRGSATMARVPRIADLALVLERIANGLRDGELLWSERLREDLRGAAVDLRALTIAASNWTPADDQRATQRLARMRGYVQMETPRAVASVPAASTAPIFVALQASAIATDLENFLESPDDRAILDDVLNRVRSLRGISGVADHPPLGDIADTVERGLRQLPPDDLPREHDVRLFRAAADVFRRASTDLRSRGRLGTDSPELHRFVAASRTDDAGHVDAESIVSIDELFYSDAGPHLLQRGRTESASPDRRFREEVVTRAEHLRRLVADAGQAHDPISRSRVLHDLQIHLGSLAAFARSFGAVQTATILEDAAVDASVLESGSLEMLDAAAAALLSPGVTIDEVEHRLAVAARLRFTTPPTSAVTPAPTAATPKRAGVSGEQLRQALRHGLDGLRDLDATPLSEPVDLEVHEVVPIETLLYRGPAALARAIEIRDRMRGRGATDPESLHELYDLLDLARTEPA